MKTKLCPYCQTEKEIDLFGKNRAATDGHQVYCKLCQKEYNKKNYHESPKTKLRIKTHLQKRRARIVIFLQKYCEDHPCVICGEADFSVLDFDHLGDKTEGISRMARNGSSLEEIQKEISKCQVLCSNCHRRKTAKERGYYKFIENLPEQVVFDIVHEVKIILGCQK